MLIPLPPSLRSPVNSVNTSATAVSSSSSFPNSSPTFLTAFDKFLKIHEHIGQTRYFWSHKIATIAEDLNTLQKNTERSRKQLKEAGTKNVKLVLDAEMMLEKAKVKYDHSSEEWEKMVLLKEHNDGNK